MPAVKTWLLGKRVAIAMNPITYDINSGVITVGAAYSFIGLAEQVEVESDPEKEDIRPMDATQTNMVLIVDSFAINMQEIQQVAGSNLALLHLQSDLFRTVITAGQRTWTHYGTRGRGNWPMAKGKNVASLRLENADLGVPALTYV